VGLTVGAKGGERADGGTRNPSRQSRLCAFEPKHPLRRRCRGCLRSISEQVSGRLSTPQRLSLAVTSLRYASQPSSLIDMRFVRVTIDPDVMGGMPCIRGLRIPVATVVAMVADQMTSAEILAELPDLETEDIAEALRYAAEAVRERELPLRPTA
jgi:uncharacterized protein (DUF433 family)